MSRLALIAAAAVAGLAVSSSFGAIIVQLNGVTLPATQAGPMPKVLPSTSTNIPGFDVYYIKAVESSGGTTAVQAASAVGTSGTAATGTGVFQFPDGDANGGVGSGTSTAAINSRSNPTGTFFFLPTATATVATNPDDAINGFANGTSNNFSIQSFRSGAAYTTTSANGIILGAIVVQHGGSFTLNGVANPSLDSLNNVAFAFNNVPEPTTLAAAGMAALGLVRRRK